MAFHARKVIVVAIASLLIASNTANATILINNNFDDGTLQDWTLTQGGGGLYTFSGSGTNFATSGVNAAEVFDSNGSGAGNAGHLTLTNPLPLDLQSYTSLQIDWNWKYLNGSSTRRGKLQYSALGNFSDTQLLKEFNTPFGGIPIDGSSNVTINEGGTFSFTDTAKLRFQFSSNRSDHRLYVDDIVVQGYPDFIPPTSPVPEPSSFAIMATLGGLLSFGMARRRKRL